jgi:hypothetical protein
MTSSISNWYQALYGFDERIINECTLSVPKTKSSVVWVGTVSSPGLKSEPHILLGDDGTRQIRFYGRQRFPWCSLDSKVLQHSWHYLEHYVASKCLSSTKALTWKHESQTYSISVNQNLLINRTCYYKILKLPIGQK